MMFVFLGEKDHSGCCKQRGIPDHCEPVCAGRGFHNYSELDCLTTLMPEISSCFIENTGEDNVNRNFSFKIYVNESLS